MSAKKSKNDIIRTTVGSYLKQKNYINGDKFRKSDLQLLQNKQQFMMQKMLDADLQGPNCFTYSNVICTTNNHHIVDQQFQRLSQFIEVQSEILRTELRRFYGPLICHLFVELMKVGEHKAAHDFLKKYAHLVAPIDTYEAPLPTKINGCSVANDDSTEPCITTQHSIRFALDDNMIDDPESEYFVKLIQAMSACQKLETIESEPDVIQFRSSKYEIHTSAAVANALNCFLEKRGHVLILNLFYTWIHINILENEVHTLKEDTLLGLAVDDEDDDEMSEVIITNAPVILEKSATKRPAEIYNSIDANKRSGNYNLNSKLLGMRAARDDIYKTQAEFTRFIKVADRCRGLTSADMDDRECHLVAGFNNSVIQLWQMNQKRCAGKNQYQRWSDSLCRWELNNCHTEEVDEIENDIKRHERSKCDLRKEKYLEGKYEGNSINDFGGIYLRGHSLGVTGVRFSSRYPLIYSSSKDSTMRCWRAENFSCGAIYRGHRFPIWCFDESPIGMFLATGSRDLTARLWTLDREFPLITYVGHTQDVECLAFHPNGNYFATGSSDLSVRLWCVTSGKLMRVFPDCKQAVTSIAISPDGKMLAAGGEESKIRIFDLAAGSQLGELKDHSASVTSISWSVKGLLASVCRDGSFRLWDVKKLTSTHTSSNNTSSSSSSSSSGSPTRLMASSGNCERLVRVLFHRDNTICCIGS